MNKAAAWTMLREPVWPGTWSEKAAKMLRKDLASAGIAHVVESATGPLVCDFHALRFTFVASLDRPGVAVRMAVQLARHSDPKLTISRYGKAQLGELSEAVSGLKAGDLLAPASTNLVIGSDGSKGCLMDNNGEKENPSRRK